MVGGTLLVLWAIWELWVKRVYTGPRATVDLPAGLSSADELSAEWGQHHPHHRVPAAQHDEVG